MRIANLILFLLLWYVFVYIIANRNNAQFRLMKYYYNLDNSSIEILLYHIFLLKLFSSIDIICKMI